MEELLLVKSASAPDFFPANTEEDSHQQSSFSPITCEKAAPPPPPPLPPPPPPPPPALLPPCPFGSRNGQRRSMKKLNWDTIPSQHVLGKVNVWTSKRPQRDLVLDIQTMEELFSHVDKQATLRTSRQMGVKTLDGVDFFPQEHQVTILDSKKSMNIGIFLRHFKRPVPELVRDIREGNWLRFGPGKLRELCKLLPEDSEVKQLLAFSGNLSALAEADQFMVQLVKVPGYEERLQTMVLREEFFPFMEEVKSSVAAMIKGANELLDCDDLHSVIRLVLKAGNYMNSGGYTANAIGFRMTSLLKLADTKANKPGMNLMHYVAKAEEIDAELLTFPSQLQHIGAASRICKEEVIADFYNKVKKIETLKLQSSGQPGFLQDMKTFLMRAEAKLTDVERLVRELNALNDAVAEYFCEDPASFKLDDCCSIFHSFCKRFDAAVQENREREAAEQRCKRVDSIRIASKRRSTVSCQGSQADLDPSSLESTLHSFLSSVPESLTRCRKSRLAPVHGSPSECKTKPAVGAELPPCSRDRAEKKEANLQKEKQLENDRIAKKVTLKGDPEDSPRRSDRAQNAPATPRTPRPTARDYYFGHSGDLGSPWTILSPLNSVHREIRLRKRTQCRSPSEMSGDDLDDGVWDSDGGFHLSSSSNQDGLTPPSGDPLLGYPGHSSRLKPPVRSASVVETSHSPTSRLSLGDLFQRSMSYSHGSRTETLRAKGVRSAFGTKSELDVGKASSSGFISLFKRFGGKTKPVGVEEPNLKRPNV